MDENQFWVAMWRTFGAALVAIAAVIGGCSSYRTHAISEMVKNGANPIDAACSFTGSDGSASVASCAIRATIIK